MFLQKPFTVEADSLFGQAPNGKFQTAYLRQSVESMREFTGGSALP